MNIDKNIFREYDIRGVYPTQINEEIAYLVGRSYGSYIREKLNKDNDSLLTVMKEALAEQVKEVRFTNQLKEHPVCLTTTGDLSLEMEKIINNMAQGSEKVKAETILEINANHEISDKIKKLYDEENKEELEKYTKILYNQARLISGLNIENPSELTNLICEMISK